LAWVAAVGFVPGLSAASLTPIATNDAYEVAGPSPEILTLYVDAPGVLGNDFPDPDTLTAVLVSDVTHGVLDLQADGSFFYAVENYLGTDSFTYVATDGTLTSAVATVTLTIRLEGSDTTPPTVVSILPMTNSVVRTLTQVEVVFSEPVTNVEAGDLLINQLPATNLLFGTPEQFVFQLAEPATGLVQVAWAADHGIRDLASPPNAFAGGSWAYWLDPNFGLPNVIISEFMASNTRTTNDVDREPSDWIELFNAGDTTVDLAGWYLTDDAANLTKWRFPSVTLLSNNFLLVWASSKNRTNPAAQLHTNFRLERNGEFLGLVRPDGRTLASAFAPRYPPQENDVSYGRDRLDPSVLGYFAAPTPGRPNATAGPGFASAVTFSRRGGTFVNPFSLKLGLEVSNAGAVIRYTLGTNEPGTNSPIFTNLLQVNTTLQVRARVYAPGLLPGPVRTEHFVRLDAPGAEFSSDLPIMLLHNFGAGVVPATAEQYVYMALFEPGVNGRSSMAATPDVDSRGRFNIRGSSTEGYPKTSFSYEAWDEYNDDKEVSLLGMPAESDWVLYAPNYFDKALIHNPLAYGISREVGRYASRTRFVEVFLNTTGGAVNTNHYWGVYVLEERIKRNKDRVDIVELEPQNNTPETVTGGYLLKIDRVDSDERTFVTKMGFTVIYQDPPGLEMIQPQRDPQEFYITNFFSEFETVLYGTNWTNPASGYPAYVDQDSWVDHHIISVLTLNVDAMRLSGYFFKDRGKKLEMGPVWDADRALGTGSTDHNDWRAFNPRSWMGSNPLGSSTSTDYGTDFFNADATVFANYWYRRVVADPDFWQRWIDRWHVLRQGPLSTNALFGMVDTFGAQLREAQPRDLTRWGGQGASSVTPRAGVVTPPSGWPDRSYAHTFPTPGTFQGELDFQKRWFADRVNFMDTNFLQPPRFSTNSGPVPPGSQLTVTPPATPAGSVVYVTLDGTDPRAPGGAISASALQVGPTDVFTIGSNLRLIARAYNPAHSNLTGLRRPPISSPWSPAVVGTFITQTPPLVITEIMYHPATPPAGDTNDANNFEYLELRNVGATPLALPGFRFTNGIQFTFTTTNPLTTLEAGERVLLVKNLAAFQSLYPGVTNIAGEYSGQLANEGERLALVGPVGEPILDFVYDDKWHPITDGYGFSLVIVDDRAPLDTWGLASSWRPSGVFGGGPGEADPPTPTFPPVRITEVLTAPVAPLVDAIELHNPSDQPADISGWFLTDNNNQPTKYRVPSDTVIPPGGYVVLDERQFNSNPGSATNFGLSSLGEEAWVFSGDGVRLTGWFHGVAFGAAETNVSFGAHHTSDGREEFVAQSARTFGTNNAYPKVGPVVIRQVMYQPRPLVYGTNPVDNAHDEYLELHNLTDQPVPLYDTAYPSNTWRLDDAVQFTFPGGTVLPAGGSLVLVNFDPSINLSEAGTFRAQFGFPGDVPLFGPYGGKLGNADDNVELLKPNPPVLPPASNAGFVPYVLVDRVSYAAFGVWENARGNGRALQRIHLGGFGNDPTNWTATLVTRPSITRQPTSAYVRPGATTNFTVAALGIGPLRYQWRRNGVDLEGATNTTLLLPSVTESDGGDYSVIVTDDVGSMSSDTAALVLLINPVIVQQPQSQTVFAGAPATLTISVVSNATLPVGYRWRRNGATFTNMLLNQTTASLLLPSVTSTTAGTYTVVLTNLAAPGGILSSSAFVAAADPATFRIGQFAVGSNVALRFNVPSNAAFGVLWKEGVGVGKLVKLAETPNYPTQWTATVVDTLPLAEGRLYVLTNPPPPGPTNPTPLILTSPRNVITDFGQGAEFRVFGVGAGLVQYQWFADGSALAGEVSSNLVIEPALFDSMGSYTVELRDDTGNREASGPALLAVRPIISDQPEDRQAAVGDTVSFEVNAASDRELRYRWRFNGRPLVNGTNRVLTLPNVQVPDAGTYSVVASHLTPLGYVGTLSSNAVLTVIQPP
jgi:hypothetical protein